MCCRAHMGSEAEQTTPMTPYKIIDNGVLRSASLTLSTYLITTPAGIF